MYEQAGPKQELNAELEAAWSVRLASAVRASTWRCD
jgi:hypothetical protein